MTSATDLASRVQNRVQGIPSAITTAVIVEYITDSHVDVENWTGDSFSVDTIPEKYQPILVNMASLDVLNYIINTKGYSVAGEVSATGAGARGFPNQIKILQGKIDKQMQNLVRQNGFSTTTSPQETRSS